MSRRVCAALTTFAVLALTSPRIADAQPRDVLLVSAKRVATSDGARLTLAPSRAARSHHVRRRSFASLEPPAALRFDGPAASDPPRTAPPSAEAPLDAVLTLAALRFGIRVRSIASSALVLQPILGVTLAPWLTIGVDELLCAWDWERRRFRAVPIGIAIDILARVRGRALRLRINPRYEPVSEAGAPEWRVSASIELALPAST